MQDSRDRFGSRGVGAGVGLFPQLCRGVGQEIVETNTKLVVQIQPSCQHQSRVVTMPESDMDPAARPVADVRGAHLIDFVREPHSVETAQAVLHVPVMIEWLRPDRPAPIGDVDAAGDQRMDAAIDPGGKYRPTMRQDG